MSRDDTESSAEIALLEPGESESASVAAPPSNKWFSVQHLKLRWQRSFLGQKLRRLLRATSTWRFIIMSGLFMTAVVLILNISLLIWSRTRSEGDMLYRGDCTTAKSKATWTSIAINVLSTLLLGASNAAMQCLNAPTRVEVDKVHANGHWLDIGVSGFRNWRVLERWRKYSVAFILLSSLPLHLL